MPVYHPNDCRLFLDSSKHSLKSILLHNGNVYAAVPIGHSVYLREEHNDIKTVIDLLNKIPRAQPDNLRELQTKWLIPSKVNKEDLQSIPAFFACGTAELEKSTGT